jgi:ribosomal protein L11 methyltransferase
MDKYFYVKLSLKDGSLDSEALEAIAFKDFNATGIEEFSIDEPRVDEILGERSYSGADIPVSVIEEVELRVNSESNNAKSIHFGSKENADTFHKWFESKSYGNSEVIEKDVEDWNESWRESYKPISVSSDFVIVPSWMKDTYEGSERHKLFIYPGMGFGTGSHETTFLCLKLLTTLELQEGTKCLDFGCGSGILGLGLRLIDPKSKIDLYDIDQEALDNCMQNMELNEVSKENINLLLPKERDQIDQKYNLVFANILKNVLEIEIDYLTKCVSPNGHLILSGLLKEQEEDIIKQYLTYEPSLELEQVLRDGDWIAIMLKKS